MFLFLGAYWLAFLINGSFDVYLEGPMGGIWFWTVYGIGVAPANLQAMSGSTLSKEACKAGEPGGERWPQVHAPVTTVL